MSFNTPTVINAQIQAIQQNKFLTDAQKNAQISALQSQLNQVVKSGYTGNTSNSPPTDVSQIFQNQQLLTKILGARASAVTATPEFVNAKASGASLADLNSQLTKQGVFVTTPELNSFNNAIQNVPLTPSDQQNVNNLLSRLNSPIITSGSTNAGALYDYLSRHGALNPNPTPNTTSVQASVGAGGGYQPPSNLPQVNIPPNFPNLPPVPQLPPVNIPNIPQLPSSPPAGGGTSAPPAPTSGFDLTSLLSNPILLIAGIALIGVLLFVFIVPRGTKKMVAMA